MNSYDNLKCGYCHNSVDKSQNRCEKCGHKIKKVKPKRMSCLGIRDHKPCAKRLTNETKYCPNCGKLNPNHVSEQRSVVLEKENTVEDYCRKSPKDDAVLHDKCEQSVTKVVEQTSFESEKENSVENGSKKSSEDENVLQDICGQSVSNEQNFVEPQKENTVDKCSKKNSEDDDILQDTIGQPVRNGSVGNIPIGIGDALADDMVEEFFDIASFKDELLRKLRIGGVGLYATYLIEQINLLKKVKVKVAIAGESGTGKSAFINAIRGVQSGDEGSAEEGCGNTTMEVTKYSHPKNERILLYDLPGYNTTKKTLNSFLKEVKLSDFDIFLMFFDDLPTIADAELVDQLRRTDTKFCFIRTKVDEEIEIEIDKDQEEAVLSEIKKHVQISIEKEGLESLRSANIFYISSHRPEIGEMNKLLHFIKDEISSAKYEAVLFSIPTVTKEIIGKKYTGLKRRIWFTAIAFAFLYPSMFKVEKNIKEEIIMYYRVFELDQDLADKIPNLNHRYVIQKHLQDFTLGASNMISVGHRYRFCKNFMLNLLNGLREDADTMYTHILKQQRPSQSS
ncbi:unnamed protein product [Mytilus coruscus]|uniref:IRG-type G domain-containing protein n=1 Tax=Mytilus coruscus TaxID=42192 RepID=A0A6J8B6U5_MYTCO|nr:unnamed protein product [Mytilus coruscus]